MDWIVFGDDWGRHPSTTQHLVRNLPQSDRIVWVDSLGMRAPRWSLQDLRRGLGRARDISRQPRPSNTRKLELLRPPVLPWHSHAPARAFNRRALAVALRVACARAGVVDPVVLAANPVAAYYTDAIPHALLAYLRLDDYARLPGVDAALARDAEDAMHARADLLLATARTLIPAQAALATRYHYLPQGVEHAHFAAAAMQRRPTGHVLGFFGLIAEWLDFALIEAVARARPAWTLELRGPVRVLPERLRRISNVHVLPPVSYAELPGVISHWRAAWIPFHLNELTRGVNPLKAREYLAAGMPTCGTALPELCAMSDVRIVRDAGDVVNWLDGEASSDDLVLRRVRSARAERDDWSARTEHLRKLVVSTSRAPRECHTAIQHSSQRLVLKHSSHG